MKSTRLQLDQILPLTCSRAGTCCHGKQVFLNPWELYTLAKAKGCTTKEFREQFCELGGILLRFDGKQGWKGHQACSQYKENFGCSVHLGRPLSCRLYPIGRQIQNGTANYIYEGEDFPCLEGCPEVTNLPQMSVGEYLEGQKAYDYELAQDAYLEVMQSIADIAFELLLDSGLPKESIKSSLAEWKTLAKEKPLHLLNRIDSDWKEILFTPPLDTDISKPIDFIQQHSDALQRLAQEKLGLLQSDEEIAQATVTMMAIALHLARALGIQVNDIAQHWIAIAQQNRAE